MSDGRKHIIQEIKSSSGKIFGHLLKLYLYPSYMAINHWRYEIYSFLNKILTLKGKNKFPSIQFILNNSYYIWEDSIDMWVNSIIEEYCQTKINYDSKQFHDMAYKYFYILATELNKIGMIYNTKVYNILKECGF